MMIRCDNNVWFRLPCDDVSPFLFLVPLQKVTREFVMFSRHRFSFFGGDEKSVKSRCNRYTWRWIFSLFFILIRIPKKKHDRKSILWRVKKRKWKWKTRKKFSSSQKICAKSRMNVNGFFPFFAGGKFFWQPSFFNFTSLKFPSKEVNCSQISKLLSFNYELLVCPGERENFSTKKFIIIR